MNMSVTRIPLPGVINRESLDLYLLACAELPGLADLLFQTGDYVFAKLSGVQRCISDRRLEAEEVERILSLTYGVTGGGQVVSGKAIDYRPQTQKTLREAVSWRANVTRCRVGEVQEALSITMRYITDVPRPFDSLGLEADVAENLFPDYGLVLIAGITGSGKSTMLSSAVRRILEGIRPRKVITFEDPIEYTYQRLGEGHMPKVSQVEIGSHLEEFSQAGPNAMRRGSDVILLGEMRDRESAMAGMELASTGHAVYATLHVETPAQVIDRIISFFPFDVQPSVASKVRANLRMVVTQKQFPLRAGGSARVRSWLVFDRAVKAQMGEVGPAAWEPLLQRLCREGGSDYDSQALPFLNDGRISFDQFCELASVTRPEARAVLASKGWSAERIAGLSEEGAAHGGH